MSAWVLNLDADLELAVRGRYTPSRSVLRAMEPWALRLAAAWLGPSDLRVDSTTPAGAARGMKGRAFCPTTRALELLARAGASIEPHPPHEVLRAVNSRAFAASLGQALPGAAFVSTLPASLAILRERPPGGGAWRIKRAFGMAGRGQRVVRGDPDAADVAFLRASFAQGGVQIEPDVTIETELAVHGTIAPDGARTIADVVRQRCDARGAWVATEPVAPRRVGCGTLDAPLPERELLLEEADRVGAALYQAGYFGPFGVDSFTYRLAGGALALQPRSEINARYSMGAPTPK